MFKQEFSADIFITYADRESVKKSEPSSVSIHMRNDLNGRAAVILIRDKKQIQEFVSETDFLFSPIIPASVPA